jgi:broad specificity phosphatase PhoE
MNVYVIRHGDVEYPVDKQGNKLMYHPDTPLSATGRDEMKALACRFQREGIVFDIIYSSPQKRTEEATYILAEALKTPRVIIDHELRDPDIPGWFGVPLYITEDGDLYAEPPRSENQETYEHMIKRLEKAFFRICAQEEGRTLAIVSHGHPIRVLIRRLTHPSERIQDVPRITELRGFDYLKRGEAWKLQLNEYKRLENIELLTPCDYDVR